MASAGMASTDETPIPVGELKMKMRELKKISANLAITLVYAEQLAGILQHREPEIILPHTLR